jgi:hypothetical protein
MASTYVNDLRLNEMATGDGSGTWGTTTNTNLELIAEAFSYGTEVITTNADTHTTTIADGATDPGRSLYLKYTGTLDSACTITIGPNTVSKVWIIENGTSGSQDIILSQGSGANITIPAGDTKVVYSDGAGAGAAFFDAFASLSVVDLKVQDDLTVTGDIDVDGTTNLDVVDIDGALTQDGGAVFNEASADVDFRVETSGNAHALFVQGSDGNVGIGVSGPQSNLDIDVAIDTSLGLRSQTGVIVAQYTGVPAVGNRAQIGLGYGNTYTNVSIGAVRTSATAYGTDDFIIATKSGTTDTAPTERIRILSSGGITFNGDTAAANALDDYEEGTWSPVFNEQSAGSGIFTKVGRFVNVKGTVTCDADGSESGALSMTGLPFSVVSDSLRVTLGMDGMNSSASGNAVAAPFNGQAFFMYDEYVRTSTTGSNAYYNHSLLEIGTIVYIEGSFLTTE